MTSALSLPIAKESMQFFSLPSRKRIVNSPAVPRPGDGAFLNDMRAILDKYRASGAGAKQCLGPSSSMTQAGNLWPGRSIPPPSFPAASGAIAFSPASAAKTASTQQTLRTEDPFPAPGRGFPLAGPCLPATKRADSEAAGLMSGQQRHPWGNHEDSILDEQAFFRPPLASDGWHAVPRPGHHRSAGVG